MIARNLWRPPGRKCPIAPESPQKSGLSHSRNFTDTICLLSQAARCIGGREAATEYRRRRLALLIDETPRDHGIGVSPRISQLTTQAEADDRASLGHAVNEPRHRS
jgi:hypothetical protein